MRVCFLYSWYLQGYYLKRSAQWNALMGSIKVTWWVGTVAGQRCPEAVDSSRCYHKINHKTCVGLPLSFSDSALLLCFSLSFIFSFRFALSVHFVLYRIVRCCRWLKRLVSSHLQRWPFLCHVDSLILQPIIELFNQGHKMSLWNTGNRILAF